MKKKSLFKRVSGVLTGVFFSIAQRYFPCNVFSKEKSAGLTIS